MIVLDGGAFTMGSPEWEEGRDPREGPQREVAIRRFAISQTEITFSHWIACLADGGCADYMPADFASGLEQHPVINISFVDANRYAAWLSAKTGHRYRLPSEAEWEYAARANTASAFPWGAQDARSFANYGADACCSGFADGMDQWIETAPVAMLRPNAFGLYDMNGNAWEWVADCYHANYAGAPNDGSAWDEPDCSTRILRGGSWMFPASSMRSAARRRHAPTARTGSLGFRVVRDVD